MTTTPDRELRVRPFAVFLFWTLYGTLQLLQWTLNRFPDARDPWHWYGPAVLWIGIAWVWALLTPFVVWLVRKLRPAWPGLLALLAHAAAIAAIHALTVFPSRLGWYLITTEWWPWAGEFRRGVLQDALLYVLVALAVSAVDRAREARERAARERQLEADLAKTRLETLRRQLQPHFLFNTLNTIAALIDTDPGRAGTMIARLGELLRRSLDEHDEALIALGSELEFVRLYTEIEQVRFESWLDVREDVPAELLVAAVPPMLLQPLVENAIKHGIAPSGRRGSILIRARRNHDRLVLEVIDDGIGLDATTREGVGLRATRERLGHLFPDNAHLVLKRSGATTATTVDLPFIPHVTTNV